MKKYLSLAAILCATVFLSVSACAQAQQPASGAAMAPVAAAPSSAPATAPAAGNAMPAASPAQVTYAKDRTECAILASTPTKEGAYASAADQETSIKKCLAGKGHSADEITKGEAVNGTALVITPAATTPAAPIAPAAH